MRYYKYTPLFFLGLALSCISPFDINTEREVSILVVDGYISTLPGPYTIQISKTARFASTLKARVKPENLAKVWIKDEEGNTTYLLNINVNGVYQTPVDFRAEVGKTYVLNITTSSGENYASLPETIQSVPKMDSIYFEYKKQPSLDQFHFISGMEVYGVWQDPSDVSNYQIWKNSGVFSIETFPELFIILPDRIPAPKDCCKICWVTESNSDNSIRIYKDNNTSGMVNTHLIAFIEDNGSRFTEKYHISIEQLSISKEAYQFFNLLKNQQSINGDIFDPPPATIRGNIINLDDPSANVIGYFHASDGYQYTAFIDRSELHDFQRHHRVHDDCRAVIGATTERPSYWE